MAHKVPAVGIDLGTTFSCVGVYRKKNVEIIANDMGSRTTPSYVAYTDEERLVGEAAKVKAGLDAANTVFDAKRLIGRDYNDPNVQKDMKDWPFKVVDDRGRPKVKVTQAGQEVLLYPEEVSAAVLVKMKEIVERYVGEKIVDVVVTVPAYFNDSQRQATRDAGKIAGLNILKILNEPTAAALAYAIEKNPRGEKNILIFDLGGGTFDVSILTVGNGQDFEVKAVAGDTHLGGEDFDSKMMNHFVNEFQRRHRKDPSKNSQSMYHLRTACERAKRILSVAAIADVIVPGFYDGIDFSSTISRAKFQDLCLDLFKNTLEPVRQALEDARLNKSQIDDVVLVGGSTRIPKIQELLKNFFDGKDLRMSINPDEAVAYGAAIQAALLTGNASESISDIQLIDVTPLSLGVAVRGGLMSKIVNRNTRIPCKASKSFRTGEDNQKTVPIRVYEGERTMAKDNHFLGKFTLTGIAIAPKGQTKAEVTFSLNTDGILHVFATESMSGACHSIKIVRDNGSLSEEEIDRMIRDSKRYEAQDNAKKELVLARNKLEDSVYDVKHDVDASSLPAADKTKVRRYCDSVMSWLEENPLASKDNVEDKKRSFEISMKPYLDKI